MTGYTMSQIRNFRSCNVGWPLALEIDAVIEEITEGWSLDDVCAVAARGVDEADRAAIRMVIAAEGLRITPERAARELHDWSREYLRRLIEEAGTHALLDEVVSTYLKALGEAERARGESYEETAARLDDPIMRAAAARWWELEEAW